MPPASGKLWPWPVLAVELQKQNVVVAASVDNTMMKVMVGARVESDRARSALDG